MSAISVLGAYVPEDRRLALATGRGLPDRDLGSALFADVSGFTALTASLTSLAGPRRGSEETSRHMNTVYDAIISAVHDFDGSVISFAGDAITCWFSGDDGRRSLACAGAMQAAMRPFENLPVFPPTGNAAQPEGEGRTVTLSVKVCVATGPVRRFMVGDPALQYMDVLAGETLNRLAGLDRHTGKGEIVVDDATLAALAGVSGVTCSTLAEGAHLVTVTVPNADPSLPPIPSGVAVQPDGASSTEDPDDAAPDPAEPEALRSWLLPTVFRRLMAGRGEFLTELRPVAALFLRFGGIDYDNDPAAGERLDAFVRWTQAEVARFEGALVQLTMGDKGSYLYIAFGAPVSHEDDPERCASAALRLRRLPADLAGIDLLGIGLGYGVMRTGAYGTTDRRTYGALGNETNLAARLMSAARSGAIIASESFHRAAVESFEWEALPEAKVKGRAETMVVFALHGAKHIPTQDMAIEASAMSMVGRRAELAVIEARLDRAKGGHGQVVAVVAEAGFGKSKLIAQAMRAAIASGATILAGACQAFDTAAPYRVWHQVFQALLALDARQDPEQQALTAREALRSIDPTLEPRFPLLGTVLDLALPETDLTRSLDPEIRAASREALMADVIRWKANQLAEHGSALVIVLEDVHWIDPLSRDLLFAVARVVNDLPLLVLASRRPPDLQQVGAEPGWNNIDVQELHLTNLSTREARRLIDLKLEGTRQGGALPVTLSRAAMGALIERAEGNPYYLEELLADLLERVPAGGTVDALDEAAWPTNLHGLILGRIDRLSEDQQAALKVASVIGRIFLFTWLHGCMPIRPREALRGDLETLQRLDLTPLESTEPLTFIFKQAITRDVSYESLPFSLRAGLHERLAVYLEDHVASTGEQHLGLLAFHYEHSDNLSKKRRYLRLAAEAAQSAFANEAALDYFGRLMKVAEAPERPDILRRMGQVAALSGRYALAETSYREALSVTETTGDVRAATRFRRLLGELFERKGSHDEAKEWLEQAADQSRDTGDQVELATVLLALGGNVLWHQGAYEQARSQLEEALSLGDRLADRQITARALHGLANIDLHQGQGTAARERFERSLAIRRDLGDEQGVANALNNLGIIAANEGDGAEAARLFGETLRVRRMMGDTSGVAVALNNLGFMAADRGDLREAQKLFQQSLTLRRDLGDRLGMAVSLNNLADLARGRQDDDEAVELYRESLTLTHVIGNRREAAAALMGLAALAVRPAPGPAAVQLASAAEALLEAIGAAMPSEVRGTFDAVMNAAEATLPPDELADAKLLGHSLSFGEAVNLALRVSGSRARA